MGTFLACPHGAMGVCRTCDLIAAEERTTEAVGRQTAAVEAADAAEAQRERARRADQEARDRAAAEAAAEARREARNAREAQERAMHEAHAAAEVDREMAWEREEERREIEAARAAADAEAAAGATALARRVERAIAVAQTAAMAEGRVLTPVEELDVRDAVEEEVEAEREAHRRAIAERTRVKEAAEREEREAREAIDRAERARQQAEEQARQEEADRLAAVRAQEHEERDRIRAEQQVLVDAAAKRLDLRRHVVVRAALALTLYATWVDWSTVFALAAAGGVTFLFFSAYDFIGIDRVRAGKYSGSGAAAVLAFTLSCALAISVLPWHHPTALDYVLLGVAAALAATPLLYKFNHVPQIAPGSVTEVVLAPAPRPQDLLTADYLPVLPSRR